LSIWWCVYVVEEDGTVRVYGPYASEDRAGLAARRLSRQYVSGGRTGTVITPLRMSSTTLA
jgi:hypothetical protein